MSVDNDGLVATGILNGTFAVANPLDAGFGWAASGDAAVVGGQGVLIEDDRILSGLSQTFLLPSGAQRLLFTLVDIDLAANADGPVDAFEVALRGANGQSLAGIAPIPLTDALLNIQTDGSVYRSSKVTVRGWDAIAQPKLPLDRSWVFEIDLTGIAAGVQATLYFDLIGFGGLSSTVVVDDVRIETAGGTNTAPTANADTLSVEEDGTLVITSAMLLGNDADNEGNVLVIDSIATGATAHGTLTANGDGTYTYRPSANYFGQDTFTYRISDGQESSAVALVTLNVTPVNDAPVALNGSVTLEEDVGGVLDLSALVSDIETPSGNLSIEIDQGPAHGVLIANADGTFTYTPSQDYFGADSFMYRVSDGALDSNAGTVSITVSPVNDAPVFTSTPVTQAAASPTPTAPADRSFQVGASGAVTVEVMSWEGVKYEAGFYRVDDAAGRVGSLRPGDAGYIEAALSADRAMVAAITGMAAGFPRNLDLTDGALYGTYLIVSPKRIAAVGTTPIGPAPYGSAVYFSFEGANPEAYDHLRATVVGDHLELGWENGIHALDRDYNDVKLKVSGFELGGRVSYAYDADATDVDGDTLTYALIDGPEGASINATTGRITLGTGTGTFDFVVEVADGPGKSKTQQAFTLTVAEAPPATTVNVEALAPTPSGVRVRFDRALDSTQTLDASAVALTTGQGQIEGAIVLDADRAGFTFVKSGAALEPGTYTLRIKAGAQGLAQLDGNVRDAGIPGYTGSFTVGQTTALGRVSIGDVTLAPGESLAKLPIQLTASTKLTAVRFSLIYDPALLTIQAATLSAGLPAGVILSANLTVPGYARFTLSALKGLAAGTMNLIDLKVSVPATAALGAVQVLDVAEVLLNANQAGADDDGVHQAGIAPVVVPFAVQVEAAQAVEASAPSPSKLSLLLGRLKEALGSSAAQVMAVLPVGAAVEAAEAPKLPLPVTPAQEGVRTLSAGPIAIDLTKATTETVSKGPSPTAVQTAWKSTFVVQPTLNPNAAIKVTVDTSTGATR